MAEGNAQVVDDSVRYIERTRAYYRALGYTKDYVWSHHEGVPFARLQKPLAESRLALITTAAPANFDGRKRFWAGEIARPPASLFTANLAWDKESTHTDDRESFLPIEAVTQLATEGMVGGLARHFVGVPTEYSQRKTIAEDAPQVLRRLRDDGADIALLCPL